MAASLLLIMAGGLTGCSSDGADNPLPAPGDGMCRLVLTVSVNGSGVSTASRAAVPGGFEDFDYEEDKWGIKGENIEQLRIIILDGDSNVEYNRIVTTGENAVSAGRYEFKVKRNDTKTVIFVANEGEYLINVTGMDHTAGAEQRLSTYLDAFATGDKLTVEELMKLTVPLENNSQSGDKDRRSFPTPLLITSIHEGIEIGEEKEYFKEFPIHRAAVKYSFRIINCSPFPHKLTGLRIDRIADREYLFPHAEWEKNDNGHFVIKSYEVPVGTAHESQYTATIPPLDLPVGMKQAKTACQPIYVPEGFVAEEVQKVSISLDGAELEEWKDLEWIMPNETTLENVTGHPMKDLPRNTHVVVNIVIHDTIIKAIADIQPYAEVIVKPPFGLDRDSDGNIVVNRYDDGTYDILDNGDKVWKDPDGDDVLKKFDDGSILCREIVYKDYIHDDTEVDYIFYFEKDRPGGNMVIIREKSAGGQFHSDVPTDDSHKHGTDDRPLFILDKEGDFYKVYYDDDGKPTLSRYDYDGAEIIQASGYQFRKEQNQPMEKYIGTYLVKTEDGEEQLRYYLDGRPLDMDKGTEGLMKLQ